MASMVDPVRKKTTYEVVLAAPEHLVAEVIDRELYTHPRPAAPHAVPKEAFITLAPDGVREVLSPGTALPDRRRKMPLYAKERVPHLWLVDPIVRSLEVYRLEGESYLHLGTFGENERVRAIPFDAIELELEALWPNTVTPLPDV